MDYVLNGDVDLLYAITHDGVELYTSQDGCYAEYRYNNLVYILEIVNNVLSIRLKGGDICD